MRVKNGLFVDSVYYREEGFKIMNEANYIVMSKSLAPQIVYMLRLAYNLDCGFRTGKSNAEYNFRPRKR